MVVSSIMLRVGMLATSILPAVSRHEKGVWAFWDKCTSHIIDNFFVAGWAFDTNY